MKKRKMPIWLKVLMGVIGVLLLVVVGYLLYLLICYKRLPDNIKLTINQPKDETAIKMVETDK